MRIFYTADLHLGHARINELSGRPFSSVEAMNAALIKRWNSRVEPDDHVYVLGDVCMGRLDESLALIKLLHGRKLLVVGNHDRPFTDDAVKRQAASKRYFDAGFDAIGYQWLGQTLRNSQRVLLCHFPYQGDSHDVDRYVDRRPPDDGKTWLLHGHVHEAWRQRGRQINVGVDAWAGAPVPQETIIEMISAGEQELPPRTWA